MVRRLTTALAKLCASIACVGALVVAPLVAPLAVSSAQAAVVDPSVITGISPTTQTVLSDQDWVINFDGIPAGDSTIWAGAMWVHAYLGGTDTVFTSTCQENQTFSSSAAGGDTNNFAVNAYIALDLYPLSSDCVDSSTPPATVPLYSTEIIVLPNLTVPTMHVTEGVAASGEQLHYSLQAPIVETPWLQGGDVALVSDVYCSQGILTTSVPEPAPIPAGISLLATDVNQPGVAPGFTLVGTPEPGTAGSYPVCISVTDSAGYTCSGTTVSGCALSTTPTSAYAWTTIEVDPALPATGAPNEYEAALLGAGAGIVLLTGLGLLGGSHLRRRRAL